MDAKVSIKFREHFGIPNTILKFGTSKMQKKVYLATTMTTMAMATVISVKKIIQSCKGAGIEKAGAGIRAEAEEGTGVRAGAIGIPASAPISLPALAPVPPSAPAPTSASTPAPVPAPALARGFCPGPGSCPAPSQHRSSQCSLLQRSNPALLQPSSALSPAKAQLRPGHVPAQPSPANPCRAPAQSSFALALLQSHSSSAPTLTRPCPDPVQPVPALLPPIPALLQSLPALLQSLPTLLESLPTMPQLIPALLQSSPYLPKLSTNQCAGAGSCPSRPPPPAKALAPAPTQAPVPAPARPRLLPRFLP